MSMRASTDQTDVRGRAWRRPLAAVAPWLAALLACPTPAPASRCGEGDRCPPGYTCDPLVGGCVRSSPDRPASGDGGAVDAVVVPELVVRAVTPAYDPVFPGQRGIPVRIELGNDLAERVDQLQLRLRFDRAGADASADYTVVADAFNPDHVAAGSAVELVARVDVSIQAGPGRVRLEARVTGARAGGQAIAARAGATGGWTVSAEPILRVTTVEDEDDTAGVSTVAAAGGLEDISLREALLIAQAEASYTVIHFDPEVFAQAAQTPIVLDPALGQLPALNRAGLMLDGAGVRPVIDGSRLGGLDGLRVSGDNVVLRELVVRHFKGHATPAGIRVAGATGVRILSCSLLDNGYSDVNYVSAQILQQGGAGLEVRGCELGPAGGVGIWLTSTSAGALIAATTVRDQSRQGLVLAGSGHTVRDSVIADNRIHGVRFDSAQACLFEDTAITGNRCDDCWRTGPASALLVTGNSADIQLRRCDLDNGAVRPLIVEAGAAGVRVEACRLGPFQERPILLAEDANEGVGLPVIQAHEGGLLRGTAPAARGRVEIFASTLAATDFLGATNASAGTWELPLAVDQPLRANFTSENGSTGELSPAWFPSPALTVTTTTDELDGGDAVETLAQIGGLEDLSLREALVLVNRWPLLTRVVFDPAVFSSEAAGTIRVGAGAAGPTPLPHLTRSGVEVDGSAARVVLDATGVDFPARSRLIDVAGVVATLRGLEVRGFAAVDGAVLGFNIGGDYRFERLAIECGSILTDGVVGPDYWGGGSTLVLNASDLRVEGCRDGMRWYGTDPAVLRRLHITRSSRIGLDLGLVTNLSLFDSQINGSAGAALRIRNLAGAELVGNVIAGNAGAAILFVYPPYRASVVRLRAAFNTLVGNGRGLDASSADLSACSFSNNLVAYQAGPGVLGAEGAGLSEDHNLFFANGDGEPWPGRILDPTDVLADPGLDGWEDGDYAPGEAAIDRGVDLGIDRNGELPGTFNGQAPDIGAVETGG